MPIYEGVDDVPSMTVEAYRATTIFIAERARTLRRYMARIDHPTPIDDMTIVELDKHDPNSIKSQLEKVFSLGGNVGLVSEAGTPCIADPGFRVVSWAQRKGIKVSPYPGPSSLMLALMASGFSGQSFSFHGYLDAKKEKLSRDLKRLEDLSRRSKQPQIFIEAPYRNRQVIEVAVSQLNPKTLLHISLDLNTPEMTCLTLTIAQWKLKKDLQVHKRPAVFVLQG